MRLGRNVTDRLWTPYATTRYITSISVIEHPDEKEEPDTATKKKVAFGFSRVLQEDKA